MRFIGVGWYIGTCILIGVLGGLWLDAKFNTGPLLVILGLFLGLIVAFYGTYRMILPIIKKQ